MARRTQPAMPGVSDAVASTEATGDRLADRVARFGGSGTFIPLFVATLVAWAALNGFLMEAHARTFDPCPFVFLNLILSVVAALQTPYHLDVAEQHAMLEELTASSLVRA